MRLLRIVMIFMLLLVLNAEGYCTDIYDEGIQKNWILIAMVDKDHAMDTINYPSGIDKIWINITSDSVFLHGFCPTVGTEYFLYAGDSIHIGSLGIQEECDVPYDWPAWNHVCATNLMHAETYELTTSELRINSARRWDLLFRAEEYISVKVTEGICDVYLKQNTPNPFCGTSYIHYKIPETSREAKISVLDMKGILLEDIELGQNKAGYVTIDGDQYEPGIYYYVLSIDKQVVAVRQMVFIRNLFGK
jgi:hypothetical protein